MIDQRNYQLTLSLLLTNLFGVRLCMLIFIARYRVIIFTDVELVSLQMNV